MFWKIFGVYLKKNLTCDVWQLIFCRAINKLTIGNVVLPLINSIRIHTSSRHLYNSFSLKNGQKITATNTGKNSCKNCWNFNPSTFFLKRYWIYLRNDLRKPSSEIWSNINVQNTFLFCVTLILRMPSSTWNVLPEYFVLSMWDLYLSFFKAENVQWKSFPSLLLLFGF